MRSFFSLFSVSSSFLEFRFLLFFPVCLVLAIRSACLHASGCAALSNISL
jgi:hypothetical protein